jgi:hypothetical protein
MELTPAERIKLNAAIVNAARTGQPLAGELQSLYDRAAQFEATKQQQLAQQAEQFTAEKASQIAAENYTNRGPAGLLNPGFPTRYKPFTTTDPNKTELGLRKGVDWGFAQGPTSDLPVTDFKELYPKRVPVFNEQYTDYAPNVAPFGKEFDFTEEPVDIKNTETVNERAQRFLDQYFPGQKPGQAIVKNPQTYQPYGNELILHDAMHDFANVGNTLRGEELITIAENVGATPLGTNRIGLKGLTQQLEFLDGLDPGQAYENAIDVARGNARMTGRTLVQQRGAAQGSSLFRDQNRVESFLSPPISQEEFNTMAQRGQEFYDQVNQNWNAFKHGGSVEWDNARTREALIKRNEALDEFMGSDPTKSYGPPRVITQRIAGGYNRGGIPYGNPLSLMNAPLVPTVDQDLYVQELQNKINQAAPVLRAAIEKEEQFFNTPEQITLREAPKQWELRADALNEMSKGYVLPETINSLKNQGIEVASPEFERDLRVYQALLGDKAIGGRTVRDVLEDTIGPEPRLPSTRQVAPIAADTNDVAGRWNKSMFRDPNFFQDLKEDVTLKTALDEALTTARGAQPGTRGFAAAAPVDIGPEGRIYLNPANLGANANLDPVAYTTNVFKGANIDPKDVLVDAAAKAKQIEAYRKALPGIKNAIRTGFNTTTDIAGSVPLFDPEFRQAIEQGDARKAATQVAKEYAIGTALAPVVGAGAGLAQRLAPQTAAAVIPAAATALRIANPVAVVSQLGGSSKINAAADKKAAQAQLQRAEAARKRGGKWKFPTPFGTVTIPELGISEAGGLFFR